MMARILLLGTALTVAVPLGAPAPAQARRNNILFIIVDNYRPAMGAYGDKEAVTPRMDALAKTSTLFSRAFCQVRKCLIFD